MKFSSRFFLLPTLLREALGYTTLTDKTLQSLPGPGDDFDIQKGALLSPILIPRVPGSKGSQTVLLHFVDFFSQNLPDWKITFQNSTQVTPTSGGAGVPFSNFIATRDPPWVKNDGNAGRLALVAHYDSKLTPNGFIGATDSAAPCAMLMHAARTIDAALTKKWAAMEAEGDNLDEHKGVQIILLDGEEAFKTWTDTDSLYGARSLAEEWEQTVFPYGSSYNSPLATIDLFVLLDLLGSEKPMVPSYFKTTHWAYKNMANTEERLRKLGMFKSSPNHPSKRTEDQQKRQEPMFLHEADKADADRWLGGLIGDDHEPFMARGVEILHLIASPFPHVWHTMDDDGEHLHMDTVEDWALLTTAFAAEWLDLEGHFENNAARADASPPRPRFGEDEKSEL